MKRKIGFFVGAGLLVAFALWTLLVSLVDVEAIGPRGSEVGFATLNGAVHRLVGVNMTLYTITDWLGLVPIAVALGFGVLGLVQWIKRRRFLKVDYSILVLGAFYIAVMAVYVLFEFVVINRRPVLIEGYLEASYPSSTTTLVMCVMPTALMQARERVKRVLLRRVAVFTVAAFTAFMVVGRLASGVHWLSDIVGGALFSTGVVVIYYTLTSQAHSKDVQKDIEFLK